MINAVRYITKLLLKTQLVSILRSGIKYSKYK